MKFMTPTDLDHFSYQYQFHTSDDKPFGTEYSIDVVLKNNEEENQAMDSLLEHMNSD